MQEQCTISICRTTLCMSMASQMHVCRECIEDQPSHRRSHHHWNAPCRRLQMARWSGRQVDCHSFQIALTTPILTPSLLCCYLGTQQPILTRNSSAATQAHHFSHVTAARHFADVALLSDKLDRDGCIYRYIYIYCCWTGTVAYTASHHTQTTC